LLDEHDQEAVARGLREGNREAWARLYDAYSQDVWRYVARLMGFPPHEVADVVQETFLKAARSARWFDASRGTLWSWLLGIAHHQAALVWRQEGRAARLQKLVETGNVRRWLDDADSLKGMLEQRELIELVRGVLSEMPTDYAALLAAKYLDERSLDDLVREFGGSLDAAKSKLARARRDFRARIERLCRDSTPLVRE